MLVNSIIFYYFWQKILFLFTSISNFQPFRYYCSFLFYFIFSFFFLSFYTLTSTEPVLVNKSLLIKKEVIKSPVVVSLSSTVLMTFTEFTSWSGPQSDHAFSPKCRSAKTAILNAAPARIWTYLTWSSNPTVRMKREKQVKDKIAIWIWVCVLFNSIERKKEKRRECGYKYIGFFFFFGESRRWTKILTKKKICNKEYVRKWLWNKKYF